MRPGARPAGVGILLFQIVVGYEWLSSGATKLVHGDFPAGLADDLRERATQSSPWYRHFLDAVVIPHASVWGRLIELGELAVGLTLIVTAIVWLARPSASPRTTRRLAAASAAAAFGGLMLAVNLALANGYGVGPIGPDSFDEGISLDVLLIGMQTILLGVGLRTLAGARRPALAAVPGEDRAVAA